MAKAATNLIENDRFAKYVGIELVEADIDYAKAKLELNQNHLNGVDFVHGGAIFTLADFAFAAASNSQGLSTVGINASISYFKTPKGKYITAEAKKLASTRKLCHYSVDLFDQDGQIIARANATGYIKSE